MRNDAGAQGGSGRRNFLRTVLSGAAVGAAARAGFELAAPARLSAQTSLSPDAAFEELLAGNRRFASNQMTSFEHDLKILKEARLTNRNRSPGALVRRFSRTGGIGFRSDDRAPFRHARGRQYRDARHDREPGIRRCRAGNQSDSRAGPRELRSGEGRDESRRSSRPNQHALSSPSAGGGAVWWQFRKGDRRQCQDSDRPAAHFFDGDPRSAAGREAEG